MAKGIQGDLLQFLILYLAFRVPFKKIPLNPPFSKGEADSVPCKRLRLS